MSNKQKSSNSDKKYNLRSNVSSQINYKELHTTGKYIYKERFCSLRTNTNVNPVDQDSSTNSTRSVSPQSSEVDQLLVSPNSLDEDLNLLSESLHLLSTMNTANTEEDVNKSHGIVEVEDEEEELEILDDELRDFLDENKLDTSTLSPEDFDYFVDRLENYRKGYKRIERSIRKKNQDLFERLYEGPIAKVLDTIKCYIIDAKNMKGHIRTKELTALSNEESFKEKVRLNEIAKGREAGNFLMNEISRLILELRSEYIKAKDSPDDDELLRRKEDYPENSLQLDRLSSKLQEALKIIPNDLESEPKVRKMKSDYALLLEQKKDYDDDLNKRIRERELLKEKAFETSALNIKVPKFKGYQSELDIYSFQIEFEKLYLRSTPKKHLPDLLKNNYLDNPALSMVRSLDNITEIWERLKKVYGDKKVMLQNKLSDLTKIASSLKSKDYEQLKDGLMKLVNSMNDLIKLSKRHGIENKLYHGEGLNMIYGVLGEGRLHRWFTSIADEDLDGEALWLKLITFLERELKVVQEKSLVTARSKSNNVADNKGKKGYATFDDEIPDSGTAHYDDNSNNSTKCHYCGESGHCTTNGAKGVPLVQYYACEKFANAPPHQRFRELRAKGLCHQCLYPGAKQTDTKHADGSCQKTFTCKHSSHNTHQQKKHVLVCSEHADTEENKALFEEYKERFITRQKKPLPEYTKNIKLTFHAYRASSQKDDTSTQNEEEVNDNSIFALQIIKVDGQNYTIFYDSGCSDLVTKHAAIVRLGKRAVQEVKGPLNLGGVGDTKVISPHGVYRIKIPLFNGKCASMAGICLDTITGQMPMYPLNTQVKEDIEKAYKNSGGDISSLPSLPKMVGGEVDIMIGSKYLRYYPKEVFSLPSGLTIYQSMFKNSDGGGRGVICGPHKLFNSKGVHKACGFSSFLSDQYQLYNSGYQVNPDINYFNSRVLEDSQSEDNLDNTFSYSSKQYKLFQDVEHAGSVISYRCVDCRGCKKCKNNEQIEEVSIKEEVEQELIVKSVELNSFTHRVEAVLPWIDNPMIKLAPNKSIAVKVYYRIVQNLAKCEKDKKDTIEAEGKLQRLGYVDFVSNLTPEQQLMLKESPFQNYLPWFVVWNTNSVTTTCRPVFHGSMNTPSGFSMNSLLAKGKNNMNKLVEIVIRWSMHAIAIHTDVKQLYNRIILKEDNWCFQRYIWQNELDPTKLPVEKVIKTVIYGIRSSGNQAERGVRMTADEKETSHPKEHEVIHKDLFADDCMTGDSSVAKVNQLADGLEEVLAHGGFQLKGFTFSGRPPDPELSKDGQSINVAGMKWFPEEDVLQLNISRLNFSRKRCGKKDTSEKNYIVPEKLTRRDCASKVGEVFDLTGRVAPITASFKVDLHKLSKLKWDDVIPEELRPTWLSNFELMEDLKNIRFKRAVVPEDAVDLNINTIDTGDASGTVAASAIYVRFLRKNGDHSCQLVFARTKLLDEGISQPRAELLAAQLNAHTGEVVHRSFGAYHKSSIKLTDSQIVLHWLNNAELKMKTFVRNRVIDICRFTHPTLWKYVKSENMPADIATRRCSRINEVGPGSMWQEGFPWMKGDVSTFPVKGIDELRLDKKEAEAVKEEMILLKENCEWMQWPQVKMNSYVAHRSGQLVPPDVGERYKCSNYLIDPNKYRFQTVVRVIAIVKLFIRKFKQKYLKKIGKNEEIKDETIVTEKMIILSDADIAEGEKYFYEKATLEVKKFVKPDKLKEISVMKDDILYFKGRILNRNDSTPLLPMSDIMIDLKNSSFVVPLIDKHSPLAYSIINEVHWEDPVAKHSGVETVLRYTMKYAYIMEGRELVRKIRKNCERCRFLAKRTIEVIMGPVSKYNLTIAPPFYITQVDLAGPYKAFTIHNKRATIKIYLTVFCCATTGTINIKVMDSYATESFIQAFIRLSCEVGYPKHLLTDEGSQLIKACNTMEFNFHDTKYKLHLNHKVDFDVCPVGGHNMHGRVERKIRQVKESLEKTVHNERLSVIEWETVGAEVSNVINDLPIGLHNWSGDLEHLDLITPNRLRLGRNNDRSPAGSLIVTSKPEKFLRTNLRIYQSWFENWLVSCVPKLIQQPKWFRTEYDLKIGDIVLFLKDEGNLAGSYQYGMVEGVELGKDGIIRTVKVKYQNSTEAHHRSTRRAVRELVMIHPIDELNLNEELGKVSTYADMKYKINNVFFNTPGGV